MFTYGFYNSLNGDRKYTAEQISAIFDGLINDGIFATIGNIFDITPGEGLQVVVDEGKAWFNHTWNVNDSKMPIDLSPADVTLPRIDAVVLDINGDIDVRENGIVVVEGDYDIEPKKPELIRDDENEHWQYPLAYITIEPTAEVIEDRNIEKMVGRDPCPFVTGILKTVDISVLFTEWQGTFEEWFEHLKYELSGDVAANLQRQIDDINDQLILMTGNVAILELTVKTTNGNPIVGLPIPNLYTQPDGNTLVITNNKGVAKGYAAEGNTDFGIKGYLDIEDKSNVINIIRGRKQIQEMVLTTRDFYKITATKNDCMFSSNVSQVDVTVVGGGGGGSGGVVSTSGNNAVACGSGGGGGEVVVQTNILFDPYVQYSAEIGSGGPGGQGNQSSNYVVKGYPGQDGGTSSFYTISAKGGSGGTAPVLPNQYGNNGVYPIGGLGGNPNSGKGGDGTYSAYSDTRSPTAGSDGTNNGYSSFSDIVYYGGGGGGGSNNGMSGGRGEGGKGGPLSVSGKLEQVTGSSGSTNSGGGGGGAGCIRNVMYDTGSGGTGGSGGSGVITIRMHLINS